MSKMLLPSLAMGAPSRFGKVPLTTKLFESGNGGEGSGAMAGGVGASTAAMHGNGDVSQSAAQVIYIALNSWY